MYFLNLSLDPEIFCAVAFVRSMKTELLGGLPPP